MATFVTFVARKGGRKGESDLDGDEETRVTNSQPVAEEKGQE
jgi:hypothetical protein